MPGQLNVVTGATGLLGSHIVEALVARGEQSTQFGHSGTVSPFLRGLGVELAIGDPAPIRNRFALRRLGGAELVYHCAARIGD